MKLLVLVLSFSHPVWLCHPLCGLLSSGTCVCPPQQCHWSAAGCKEVCHRAETARCCENQRYRYVPCLEVVEHPFPPPSPSHCVGNPWDWGSPCFFTSLNFSSSSPDLQILGGFQRLCYPPLVVPLVSRQGSTWTFSDRPTPGAPATLPQ